jgi:hypothetical protein
MFSTDSSCPRRGDLTCVDFDVFIGMRTQVLRDSACWRICSIVNDRRSSTRSLSPGPRRFSRKAFKIGIEDVAAQDAARGDPREDTRGGARGGARGDLERDIERDIGGDIGGDIERDVEGGIQGGVGGGVGRSYRRRC